MELDSIRHLPIDPSSNAQVLNSRTHWHNIAEYALIDVIGQKKPIKVAVIGLHQEGESYCLMFSRDTKMSPVDHTTYAVGCQTENIDRIKSYMPQKGS